MAEISSAERTAAAEMERIARFLCKADHNDPDRLAAPYRELERGAFGYSLVSPETLVPQWRLYLHLAVAVHEDQHGDAEAA